LRDKGAYMAKGNPSLRKRQFINVIKNTINDCLKIFGYSKKPYILETSFNSYAVMMFVEGKSKGSSAIYFDYQKFQKLFRNCDGEGRVLWLIHIVAHEMRHYYQYRQITSQNPKEDEIIIQEWKSERVIRNHCQHNEYFGNVRELDAYTFSYIYTAERFDMIPVDSGLPQNYRIRMRNYAKKLYGKSHKVFGAAYAKYFS